ncbi:MAG TPA: sodium:calcium antiporter [Candidatus Paceibacterota bacterium]|nr:sodium:calcium antiporter [Candidatus Paceibacterota bacterium]HRZ34211.1 sodium:calcium antiporter [Candidatus Paceibacterota bacterium]
MSLLFVLVFFLSCALLMISGNWIIKALSGISEFLGWKEFTVAFIIMSIATASPELLVGVSSAIRGIPELSLGNIIGQNIIHFTVAIFILVLIRGRFSVRSRATRTATLFSAFMAIFPLILVLDGSLSRIDGLILILLFLVYTIRLIQNSKRRESVYDVEADSPATGKFILTDFTSFLKDVGILLIGVAVLLIASQGIISSSIHFVQLLNLPLVIVGAVIVGIGTSLPEIYFSAASARKEEPELMAGNLLGSTVVSTSLVLGIVSLISPVTGISWHSYATSRIFLFISVCLFISFIWPDKKISRTEAWILFTIYLLFIATEMLL